MEPFWTGEEEELILPQAITNTLQNDFDDADSDEKERNFDQDGIEDSMDSCTSDED
jgi:hypothetical protein